MIRAPGDGVRWLRASWLAVAMLVMVTPWLALVWGMGRVEAGEWLSLAVPLGGRLRLLATSVGLALSSSLLATGVGVVVAVALWPAARRVRLGLIWALLAFASIPPYIHALVWSRAAGLTGWVGACWVQAAWFGPLALAFAMAGLDTVDTLAFDAARLHVPAWRAFVRVALPSCRPFQLASVAVCFAIALLDFTVPSLFHLEVYSLDLFSELGATEAYGRVVWMSLPLVCMTAGASWLLWRSMRVLPTGASDANPRHAFAWPWWFAPVRVACGLFALSWLAVPLVALLIMTGSPAQFWGSLQASQRELGTTATVAPLSALFSLLIAYPWSREMARGGARGATAWALLWIPLALPPSLLAMGLIDVWNRPMLDVVTQSEGMLVLSSVQRYAPCAALILWAAARQRNRGMVEAMLVHQRSRWHGWLHVGLRLGWAGWVAAGALVFSLSAGELGASLLVAPPGHATLTMRLYNYLHAGAADAVAGTALTMWAWTLGAGLVGFLAIRRGARRGESS